MESPNLETQTNKSGRESSHIPNDNAPACTCVCVRGKRANDSLETDTWHLLNQTIYSECVTEMCVIFSHSNLSLCPVYQPVPVRRDAVSLFNRSISLPFPCHANKKRGLWRIRAGKRTLLPCKRDWRHFSAPQREGWTAERTWAGGGQIH